jgi:malate synthase
MFHDRIFALIEQQDQLSKRWQEKRNPAAADAYDKAFHVLMGTRPMTAAGAAALKGYLKNPRNAEAILHYVRRQRQRYYYPPPFLPDLPLAARRHLSAKKPRQPAAG